MFNIFKILKKIKAHKIRVVRNEWLRFYEIREKHLGTVELPAFILADKQVKSILKAKELDFYYNRITAYRAKLT